MRIFPRSYWSIRAWLLVLTAAIVLPAAGGFAWYAAHEAQQACEAAYAKVKILADGVAASLDLTLRDHEALLSLVAAEFHGNPPVRAPRFDPDQFIRVHPQILNFNVRDLHANSIYFYLPNPFPPDEAQKFPWVEQGLRSESFAGGDAFQGRLTGRWVTFLTYPVRDEDGKRSGFVNLALDLLALNQRVLGSVPKNAVVAVIDREEKFMLRSIDPEHWIGRIVGGQRQSAQVMERFRREGFFSAPGSDDVQRLYAVVKIPGTGWRVVAGLPEDEVLAPARALLTRTIAIGIIILLSVLALAWWLADTIARPIRGLAATAGDVARGDTAARAHVTGPGEIMTVAQEFNHMLDARARAEAALQESEERFRRVSTAAHDAIIMLDNAGRITFWNEAAQRIFGYGARDVQGRALHELIVPKRYRGDFEKGFAAFRSTGQGPHIGKTLELAGLRKDGTEIVTEHYFSAIQINEEWHALGIVRDITERKQAEEALRDSRNMLKLVLDSIPSAVFWKDRDSIYLGGNRTWLEVAGLKSSEESVGKSDYDLPWEKKHGDSFREYDRRVMESGIPEYGIIEPYRRADGSHAWAKTNKVPLRDTEGNVIGVLGTYEDITERKHVEMALQASEAMLRHYVENTPAAVAIVDTEMRYLLTSKRWLTDYRLGERDIIGISHYEVFPENPERWKEIHRRCLAGAVERCEEDSFPRQDGSLDWVRWELRPWRNASGAIGGIVMFTEVITERKRAEETQARLAAIVDSSNDGIVSRALDRSITSWNAAAERILGYTAAEVIGRDLTAIIPPEQQQDAVERRNLAAAGAMLPYIETTRIKKDGRRIDVGLSVSPIRDNSGKVIGTANILRDISERKQAEATLRESEDRYRDLVEHSQDLICTHDLAGRILSVTPWAAKNLGYEPREMLGMNIRDVLAPRVRHEFDDYLATIRADGAANGLMLMQTRTGEKRIWEYANTLRTVGVPTPVVRGMAHDITERKRAEEELRASHEQLRALAVRLDTVREQETAMLAREIHDELGQVLTGLNMDLFWLSQQLPKDLPLLAEKAASMSALVEATLQTVRNISGSLRPRLLDDFGLVPAIESQLQEFAKHSGIKCEFVSGADVSMLGSARSTVVFRIVQEALTNVARHAAATRVDIGLHKDSDCLMLEVRDNGKGIRAEEVASAQSLGLLGMHERALVFGGEVTVTGRPGRGTVVTLRIPFPAQ